MLYTVTEKIQMIKWCYQGQSRRQIQSSFINKFPDRPTPALSTINNVIKNFDKYGCVDYCNHSKDAPMNEEREERNIMICALANSDPTLTPAEIADQVDTSASTVRAVLKKNGYGK